ncbi:hypothetical protein [Leptospira bandrabouensis]|uniref:Outer membrane protein beta-barrel domain-containing protein n=1 Tax=Leptospira bandrabouensis TaxID=2484903 RepID=A0A6H3NMD1_9LEPT|nr:hypothetical protein [Leptospira bandrabouensis]TGN13316.1 hypothetical protein EHR08_11730 [Leptospira bandrabouensis]
MKNKYKNILLLFITLVTNNVIFAEPNRHGLFLEVIYGNSISNPHTNPNKISGNLYSNRKGTVDALGYYVRTFGNENEILLSTYAFRNAQKPKISGENYSFFIEYVFKSNIGLGLSFNQHNINIDNLSIDKFYGNILLNILTYNRGNSSLSIQERTNIEIISPYLQFDIRNYLIINTLSANISYHFLNSSNFDPYIRLHAGYGNKSNTQPTVVQYGITLGTRYFISDNFYIMSEIQGNRFDAILNARSLFGNGGGDTIRWSLNEVNLRIGTGLNVW